MHDIDDKIQFWCLYTNFKPLRAKKPILAIFGQKCVFFNFLKKSCPHKCSHKIIKNWCFLACKAIFQ